MNDLGPDQGPWIDGAVPGKKEGATSMAERSSEEEKIKCKEKITREERKGSGTRSLQTTVPRRNTIPFIRV
jgi:hypothetical protein